MSSYGTSCSSIEQNRRNLIRPPSSRCTWRKAMSFCSVAVYSFTGIMTRPKETAPFHMLRMASPYPAVVRVLILTLIKRECHPAGGYCYNQCCPHSVIRQYVRVPICLGGAVMTDMGLEAPDLEAPEPDAAEQHQEVLPDSDDGDLGLELQEPPLEANQADAAEQAEVVIPDDEEYR